MHAFLKNVIYSIGLPYLILISILGFQTAHRLVHQAMNSHHVIFDDLGQLSTGVTYINVAIPLKVSVLYNEIDIFKKYLESIYKQNTTTTKSTLIHETINAQNMDSL